MATITGALKKGDVVINVDASNGVVQRDVPDGGYRASIDSETVWVYETSASGKQLRVKRAIDGTVAAVHAAGATITFAGRYVRVFTKAGAISDADFPANALPSPGTLGFDTTNLKIYAKVANGNWKSSAALT